MRTLTRTLIASSVSALVSYACTAQIDDVNVTVDDPVINANTDVQTDDIEVGQSVPFHAEVENVVLVDPKEEPPPAEAEKAGHLRVFLDDEDTEPILITAEVDFDVVIPASTPPGDHVLIIVVFKHDGTPTSAKFTVDIKVHAKGTSPDPEPTVGEPEQDAGEPEAEPTDAGEPEPMGDGGEPEPTSTGEPEPSDASDASDAGDANDATDASDATDALPDTGDAEPADAPDISPGED